jgi:hypothetical protein
VDREKQILEQVDKTLQALDHLPRLEANPFLFTRIQTALAADNRSTTTSLVKKIDLKTVIFSLLIIFNLVTAFYYFQDRRRHEGKEQLISALSSDYESVQNIY